MACYKKIVAAIDLNTEYQHIVDKVGAMSSSDEVEVILVSVVDLGVYELASSYKNNIVDEVKADFNQKLEAIKSDMKAKGVKNVKTYVGVGVPKIVLAHQVYELFNPDLLICGDRISKKHEKRILIGSVANYVLHYIGCDVLVAKIGR